MKKKQMFFSRSRIKDFERKILLKMKLTLILIIAGVINLAASESYSQTARLDVKLGTTNVESVLEHIENQSEYWFVYNRDAIDLNRKVTINVEKVRVKDILNELFENTGVKYQLVDKTIVLTTVSEQTAQIQKKDIQGTISDEAGEPLPGVTVLIKGTTNGTVSDYDGKFQLSGVDAKTILQISFMGMRSQEIEVGSQNVINIVMLEDAIGLEEVVAVGYQMKRKTNLTGSVSTISSEQLENRPVQKLSNLMTGLAPGLNVSYTNPGRVGGGEVYFNIGGTTSRYSPGVLLVVDGVVQPSINALDFINPNDVENISVLKDAEAVIYGARGSGGVLVVTTKKGKAPKVSASVSSTFTIPHYYSRKEDMYTFFTQLRKGWEDQGDAPTFRFQKIFDYMDANNIQHEDIFKNDFKYEITDGAQFFDANYLTFGHNDWFDFMYGTAMRYNYDVSASGSTKNTNYYLSGGVVDEGGMLQYGKNDALTYYTRVKYEYSHKDYLKIGVNVGLRYQKLNEPTYINDVQNWTSLKHTSDLPYTKEGRYNTNFAKWYSPLALAVEGGQSRTDKYNVSPQFFVELKPFRNMVITGNVSRNMDFVQNRNVMKNVAHYDGNEDFVRYNLNEGRDRVMASKSTFNSFIGNLQARYVANINDKHTIRSLVGTSHEEYYYDKNGGHRFDLVNDGLPSLNMGNTEEQYNWENQYQNAIKSYFGNLSYSYNDKYVIEGNIRHDGSSRFIEGKKWDTFFGAGLTWNISQEPFFKNLNLSNVDFLKLRGTWGQMGNENSIGYYDFVSRIKIGQSGYVFGESGSYYNPQYATTTGFPAIDRTWEVAEKTNAGVDLTMYKSRLEVNANVFVTTTDNMFYSEEFPTVLGTSAPSVNGASVKAKGWDLSIKWKDKIGTDFQYYAGIGISDVRSKVESLSDSRDIGNGVNAFVEGQYVNSAYGLDFGGFFQSEEELAEYKENVTGGIYPNIRVGDAKYLDKDGDGQIEDNRIYKVDSSGNPTEDSGDLVKLGETGARYRYFVNLGASWKGFDFSMLLNGIGRLHIWNFTAREYDAPWRQPLDFYYGNTWTEDNRNALYPRMHIRSSTINGNINGHNYRWSNAPYVKRSVPYLAIKNVQLGYNLPKAWANRIKTERLYVYVSGTDLGFLINKMPSKSFTPYQPYQTNLMPVPSTVSLGLKVNF
ncbi:SusC/RagA family TonB-linked outer membrane protein [Puteibacter caeruleilacunae]|nr:SusC/RagA family TonB-linked outer membrane protein [Puteibacter caeruleilacunae]